MIDLASIPREEVMETVRLLCGVRSNSALYKDDLDGRNIAKLFFTPDRDAGAAVDCAAGKLSGRTFAFSPEKGESLKDAVLAAGAYSDAVVLRHTKKGAAFAASLYSPVPVINAGDGGASPCGALRDLASTWLLKSHVSNQVIAFAGDVFTSPEALSYIRSLGLYRGNKLVFCDAYGRDVPSELSSLLEQQGREYSVADTLSDVTGDADVLYMTYVDKARFASAEDYKARKGSFILDERLLFTAKDDMCILHPFPRGEELPDAIDDDQHAQYLFQSEVGLYAYMTAFIKTFRGRMVRTVKPDYCLSTHQVRCSHSDCITSTEPYLPALFDEEGDALVCRYCKGRVEK